MVSPKSTLRKTKQKLPADVYAKLYSTGSPPGKYYGRTKIHKLSINGTVKEYDYTLVYRRYLPVSTLLGKIISPSSEPSTIYCIHNTKTGIIKIFTSSIGKNLCWALFFNNVAALKVFSCKICEIFKSIFFIEHLRWLLLEVLINLQL